MKSVQNVIFISVNRIARSGLHTQNHDDLCTTLDMTACLVTQKEIIIELLSLAELPSIGKQTRCLHLVNKH